MTVPGKLLLARVGKHSNKLFRKCPLRRISDSLAIAIMPRLTCIKSLEEVHLIGETLKRIVKFTSQSSHRCLAHCNIYFVPRLDRNLHPFPPFPKTLIQAQQWVAWRAGRLVSFYTLAIGAGGERIPQYIRKYRA